MNIRDYDPSEGQAFQGDVSIIPIPNSINVDRSDEIAASGSRLLLAEGEATGHHHAIDLFDHPRLDAPNRAVERLIVDANAGNFPLPSAKLFRDAEVVEAMLVKGVITRTDLIIAVLVIETGPMVLSHDEHDDIRIPPGAYLVGRQVESAGAEERAVQD